MWDVRRAAVLLLVALGAATDACRGATEIDMEITTDARCADVRGTSITVGHLVEIEQKPSATVTSACDPSTGRIGSLVLVPSGAKDDTIAVRVVTAVGKDVSECVAPAYGPGCIVARRALRFIPGTSLRVPILMATACGGIPCGETETCVQGDCASATIEDPSACASDRGCGEDALGARTPPDGGAPDGAARDAGADAGEPPVPTDAVAACGRPSTYVDDFTSATLAPEWSAVGAVTSGGGRVVVTSGRLESKLTVNLQGDRVRVEVPAAPSGTAVLAARSLSGSGDELAITLAGGSLVLGSVVGGAHDEAMVPWDAAADRWWQIDESGGQIRFQTSPDAIAWTTRKTLATPAFAPAVKIVLEASGGSATFARLNAGRPRAPWCKAATLVDDFSAGGPGLAWTPIATGACTIAETNSYVVTTMTGTGVSSCAWLSTTAYDLTASSVYTNVPAITMYYAPVHYFLRVQDVTGRKASLTFLGTNFLEESADGVTTATTPYASSTDIFWRLREAGGTLFWETGPTAAAFVAKSSAVAPFPLAEVQILIGADTATSMPGPISIAALGIDTSN